MSNFRTSGPVCGSNARPLDAGTLALCWTSAPAPVLMCVPPPPRRWYKYCRAGGFAASTLTMSPEAVALLQAIEGLRLEPYDDQTGKEIYNWEPGATIGYGHLIPEAEWFTYNDGISKELADTLFLSDLAPFERVVGETITVGVQQYEYDAMVFLAFNIGRKGFRNSAVARLVNEPKDARGLTPLENAWKARNTSQGSVNKGLINRRAAEWRIFTSAIYQRW